MVDDRGRQDGDGPSMTPDIAHSTSNSTPSPTPGWNRSESSTPYRPRPRPRSEGRGPDWPSSWTLPRPEVAFEAAFEHSYNAMVITDADFDGGPFIRRCNPAFCAMTGYTQNELIGQSPRILQGPDTDRQLIEQLDRTIRAGEFFEGSTFNYRKDGGSYIVEWNISPVRDADGAIVAYISIQRDITVRFSAERAAEEARNQQAGGR